MISLENRIFRLLVDDSNPLHELYPVFVLTQSLVRRLRGVSVTHIITPFRVPDTAVVLIWSVLDDITVPVVVLERAIMV